MTFMKRLGIDPEDSSQEDDLNDIECKHESRKMMKKKI